MKTFKATPKCLSLLLVLFLSNPSISQVVPSASGYIPSSQEYWDSVPLFVRSTQSNLIDLPSVVDNSTKIYFPQHDDTTRLYIYNQVPTAACQNISTAWYTFTYEINRLRNLQANTQETRYAPNFSYNHLNRGHQGWQGYTSLERVQKFLMESGAMSDAEFDGPEQLDPEDSWRWPTGYDKYYHVLTNKLDSVQKFDMAIPEGQNGSPSTIAKLEATLNDMKHYLAHHNEGSNDGGVITIGVISLGPQKKLLPPSPHADDWVIHNFQYVYGGHAMTIVGYNDSICFDWGGAGTPGNPQPDGQFRNDIDNNNDGIIDMRDWEIGAFKVANSYGPDYQNDGFIWIMYSFLPYLENIWFRHEYYALYPKSQNIPEVVLKVKLDADKREDLAIGCGYAPLANFQNFFGNPKYYTGYTKDGGNLPIQGKDKDENLILGPIEVLFDYNHFYSETDYGKAFLVIRQDSSSSAELYSYSLVDYRWNEEFELPYDGQNITINPGTQSFGIEYHLIPHEDEITEDIIFEANRVSRFNPILANNSTMTIIDDVRIDMYNSQLTINNGSLLDVGDNVVFLAKQGNNNITIKGDAVFGHNVAFIAEEDALLTINFENASGVYALDSAYLENVSVFVSCQKLEIMNSLVLHGQNNTTIIDREALLVINNSAFSASGDLPWRGIEVWGNPNLSQIPPTNQGWVQVTNGGIIENAVCGIRTSKTELQNGEFVDVYGYSGGIVLANEAVFRNNRTAVKFLEYGFDKNLSYFQNCEFVTDNELLDGSSPEYFINLEGVKNVDIRACTFSNTTNGDVNDPERGGGIFAVNADILVSSSCKYPGTLPIGEPCPEEYFFTSDFNGLYYGVYGLGTGQNRKVKINQGVFNNNFRGLFISALHNASVTRNAFNVYREQPVQNPESFGFRIEDADGYQIEENHFTGFDDNGVRYGVGLLIENSGSDPNMVYNNHFEDLHLATLAVGMNRNQYNNEGLCYKCNDFVNNNYDIRVSGQRTEGIALHQGANLPGNNKAPAGNVFSSAPVNSNFFNGTVNTITYHRHQGPSGIKLSPYPFHGPLIDSTVANTIYSKAGSCPSNLDGSGSPIEEQKMMAAGQQADSVYNELALLVDKGDTDAMKMEVQSTTEATANDTYDQLVQASPYLSDTVLKTTIVKEDVLTNSMIRDVMVANPQSGKSEDILDMLEAKFDPMPESMMADIYDGKLILGGREMLEAEAAHYSRERYRAFSNLFRLYYADTLDQNAYNNLLAMLAAESDPAARYKLAFLHLDNNELALAGQTLAAIPLAFDLDDNALDIHQAYLDLTDIWLQIMDNPIYFSAPDTGIINDLMALYNAGLGLPSVFARNILLASGLLEYEPIVSLTEPLKRDRFYRRDVSVQEDANPYLKLYPNPTSGTLTLEYKLDEGTKYAGLVFTDMQGISQRSESLSLSGGIKHLSVKDLKPGVYMVSLFLNNKQVAVQRLTIAY